MLWLTTSRFKNYVATLILLSFLFFISPVFGATVRWENYPVENNIGSVYYGANWWMGQTFTVYGTTHNLTSVKICLARIGNPSGNMTIGLRATSNELPTGDDLSNSTKPCSEISTSKGVVKFTMSPVVEITNYTLYGIVFRVPESNATNRIHTYGRTNMAPSGTPYEGGYCVETTDGGSTWTKKNVYFDHYFEIWGEGNSAIQVNGSLATFLINNTQTNVVLGGTFDETTFSRILSFKTAGNFYVDVGDYREPTNVYVGETGKDWTYNSTLQRINLTTTKRSGAYLHESVEMHFWTPKQKGTGTTPSPSYPSPRRDGEIEIDLPIVPAFRINKLGLIIILGGIGFIMIPAFLKRKPSGRRKPRGIRTQRRSRPKPPSPPKRRKTRTLKRDKRGRFVK